MEKRWLMGIKYTQEFKDDAVRLVLSGEATMTQIARDLGINPNTLGAWKKEYCSEHKEPASAGKVGETPQAELARLRREVRRLRMERDILKKAVSIFSEEQGQGSSS
jgi:transposase-like protein